VWETGGKEGYFLRHRRPGARRAVDDHVRRARVAVVGLASVALAMLVGVGLGLLAGYVGGPHRRGDHARRRRAAVVPGHPDRLVDRRRRARGAAARGARRARARGADPRDRRVELGPVRAHGARLDDGREEQGIRARPRASIGVAPIGIMRRHLLPNVLGPVLVLATINIATAIITEATLSFLGVGVPATQPSLGTLIRVGNDFLFSGEWWITVFPGAALVIMVLSINLLGDWLRDALNPSCGRRPRGVAR
jgi:peptide/nickel transport system permease protein